jgi:hypothetical protein
MAHVGFFLLTRPGRLEAASAFVAELYPPLHPQPWNRTLGLILLILIVVLLVGGLPTWRYSRDWGYGPSGLLGVVLAVLLILLLLGYIPRSF